MTPIKWLVAVLVLLGALALAGAIVYFTVPAHSLPSILGTLPRVKNHRKRRGEAALAIAIVLWVIAAVIYYANARSSSRRVGTGT
jgi:hypothetical protein